MTQEQALKILKDGYQVFLTGPAGSGKTYVLNEFIRWCQLERGLEVAVTASTGIAATHLNGQTIHSWAGIGIKDRLSAYDLDEILQKEHLHKRFKKTDVLILDEISMMHSYRLDMVDEVLRTIRDIDEPFGGLQTVLCGDFFQLPPINRDSNEVKDFAFEAKVWRELKPKVCYLDQVYRQDDDALLTILQEIRAGDISEDSTFKLQERLEEEVPHDTPVTRLFTHNVDVDRMNADQLTKIVGESKIYAMSTTGKKADLAQLIKYCMAQQRLELKIGAQVMFIKNNFQKGYANGTLGTVIDFEDVTNLPVVETREGKRITVLPESWAVEKKGVQVAELRQFPLRLAWAITVHKSQGMTLDAAEIDLSKSFAPGMGYVALSRVRSINGLFLTGANQQALLVHPLVREQDDIFLADSLELEQSN
ncbi:MAG: helicase [Candidatus Kerfeldbacteria bacterium CG15_BIG_FIL_POST_REV_8_21_14_020_45_12]|uniref:Helicase n=1 Tax=Candidatus Kerfeldbacteria bacterium CG15_BIG_FIL_POST_REV_8_21_14_020_45_12 TaxID=2014247 RepID=A0A2M7H4Z8_9BACT|nr:MAG: helicase [Candidatus Kerfeldbacteria bacterium CG15_BIG_FIL_POST_REV_8_21_14_020_45_12]PJA93180.1 MAG: helicase [Candidatus Kerfeldbacteria bacterium CG_4_9_14_3_um_filter_45_8]